ncbi:hypothetical protein ILYODFUR_028938 [Ilyodon furcidens]|uniref:Uncharacterized protein n=1 Tax=Ilyodon furcidens TaxID=33524 RepID=A0ABV0TEE5_9TELE
MLKMLIAAISHLSLPLPLRRDRTQKSGDEIIASFLPSFSTGKLALSNMSSPFFHDLSKFPAPLRPTPTFLVFMPSSRDVFVLQREDEVEDLS